MTHVYIEKMRWHARPQLRSQASVKYWRGGSVICNQIVNLSLQYISRRLQNLNNGFGDLIIFFKLQFIGHILMPHTSFTKLGLNKSYFSISPLLVLGFTWNKNALVPSVALRDRPQVLYISLLTLEQIFLGWGGFWFPIFLGSKTAVHFLLF